MNKGFIGWIILGVVALILGGLVVKVVFFPVNTASKLVDTAYQAQDKVLNADNAIYNYEWFKQKKQDIDATGKQLVNANDEIDSFESSSGPRTSWTFEDKTEDARLHSVKLGLEDYLNTEIADYNARASEATRNIFADHVLPDYIDALTFTRK